jgi:hypothetical protein
MASIVETGLAVAVLSFLMAGVYSLAGTANEHSSLYRKTSQQVQVVGASNSRKQADELVTQAQQVAGAVMLYANSHQGQYPENLNALIEEHLLDRVPSAASDLGGMPFYLTRSNKGKYSLRVPVTNAEVCVTVDQISGVKSADPSSPFALGLMASHSPYSCYGSNSSQIFTFDI